MKPIEFVKVGNFCLLNSINDIINRNDIKDVAIEHMQCQSSKSSVGKDVFETCYFIGRLTDRILEGMPKTKVVNITPIFRREEKIGICGTMTANDSMIRKTLIEMYAKHDFKYGKGNKKNPDWFFGFKADIWQAYAQCYILKLKLEGKM
jgi:hypothetical protein